MTCVKILWNLANLSLLITLLTLTVQFTTSILLALGIVLFILQLLVTIVFNNRLRDTEETKEQPLNDCVLALFNSLILMCTLIYFVLAAYAEILQYVGAISIYLFGFNLFLLLLACLHKNGHYCIYKFCKREIFGTCERKLECNPNSRISRGCAKVGDKIVTYIACQCCCKKKVIKRIYPQISLQPTVYSYTVDQTPTKSILKKEYPRRHHSSNSSCENLSESMHYPTSRVPRQQPRRERMLSNMDHRFKTHHAMSPPNYKENSTMKVTNISISPLQDSDDESFKQRAKRVNRHSVRTVISKTKQKLEKVKRTSTRWSSKKNPTMELSNSDKNLLHDLNICSLCIEEFRVSLDDRQSGQELTVIQGCQHNFHKQCLVDYIAKKEQKCPICKRDLFQNKIF